MSAILLLVDIAGSGAARIVVVKNLVTGANKTKFSCKTVPVFFFHNATDVRFPPPPEGEVLGAVLPHVTLLLSIKFNVLRCPLVSCAFGSYQKNHYIEIIYLKIKRGVPRGLELGPLLFNIF